jgi:SAM-dependent methyltransferase
MGMDELVRRAAAFIYLEYQQLKPIFEMRRPGKVADIGCGYALFDLFLAHDYECDVVLIDLETNENRHFGFKSEGAAYSSLSATRRFLEENNVPSKAITTVNPETEDENKHGDLDYAFSFISCGYHYPWTTYRTFFETAVKPDGRIILDIRSHKLADAMLEFSDFGYVRAVVKAANNSADRVMIAKSVNGA